MFAAFELSLTIPHERPCVVVVGYALGPSSLQILDPTLDKAPGRVPERPSLGSHHSPHSVQFPVLQRRLKFKDFVGPVRQSTSIPFLPFFTFPEFGEHEIIQKSRPLHTDGKTLGIEKMIPQKRWNLGEVGQVPRPIGVQILSDGSPCQYG